MEPETGSAGQEPVQRKEEGEEEKEREDGTKQTGLAETLNNIQVSDSQALHSPESYRTNSPDEIQLLAIAGNFQRQYSLLFPDRKPLLLCHENECGVMKFVSTTLRPTMTSHPELVNWQGCASFVADFLSLNPLEPPEDLPRQMSSSTSVLRSQRANCFEFASLLCCLLLGLNYDAYCVSGYAVKEMCLLEQSSQQCPLLDTESDASKQELNKYKVKLRTELKSLFLMEQEKKTQEAEATLLPEENEQADSVDSLHGLRVHCWVLVLSGSHSVEENFFIDPLTGNSYTTDSNNFLGIETVWNNFNCYVNMQDCRNGCAGMKFDLEDLKMWEPVLYGAVSKQQLKLQVLKREIMINVANVEEEEQAAVFEMPRSWISLITISNKDLETRWPGGQKVTWYKKAKLERYAACLNADGLVQRLTTYKDLDCTEVAVVREQYKHRRDNLEERELNKLENLTSERFGFTGCFHLSFHRWRTLTTGTEREMHFSSVYLHNVVRRELLRSEMKEFFQGRSDFLYYRHVFFDQPVESLDLSHQVPGLEILHVLKVVERFHRNASIPANEDVEQRVFLVDQKCIKLTYHFVDYRLTQSQRCLTKPETRYQRQPCVYQVYLLENRLKTGGLNRILEPHKTEEDKLALQIKNSLKEVRDILACRELQERDIELLSPKAEKEKRWLQEMQKDILSPLLIRLGNPETLSPEKAKQLYQSCLSEFKLRMMEQTKLLQQCYEKETEELQEKQKWYQQNHLTMTKQEIDDYQRFCSEKTLQISATQIRINRHNELTHERYNAFNQKLQQDPRLVLHL
ncbi:dynein regulatory complex subunit 7 [Xenentodon cancila]